MINFKEEVEKRKDQLIQDIETLCAIPSVYDEDEIVYHKQFEKDMLPPNQRKKTFEEVVLGFHKLNAIAESMRCLHCERR